MIIITDEIQKNEELSIVEKVVLSIYKYYTEKGKYKCCTLTNAQIADELKISKHYIKKIRNHLEDLGYISAKGIKVVYLGKTDTIVSLKTDTIVSGVDTIVSLKTDTIVSGVDTIVSLKGTPEYPLKKENEETKKEVKEELKEEGKKATSNFEVLVAALPEEHKTQEKIDYLKDEVITGDMLDRLNKIDINDGGIKENWIKSMIIVLNKKFPVEYYVAPKVEPKKEEHSWWEDD